MLDVSVQAELSALPFASRIQQAAGYVYFCRVYASGGGCEVAVWWQDRNGLCYRLTYATGRLSPELPAQCAEEILRKVESTGRPIPEVVAEVTEAWWPRVRAEFERSLEEREPLLSEEKRVSENEVQHMLREAEALGLLTAASNPGITTTISETAERIAIRNLSGRANDVFTQSVAEQSRQEVSQYIAMVQNCSGLSKFYE